DVHQRHGDYSLPGRMERAFPVPYLVAVVLLVLRKTFRADLRIYLDTGNAAKVADGSADGLCMALHAADGHSEPGDDRLLAISARGNNPLAGMQCDGCCGIHFAGTWFGFK